MCYLTFQNRKKKQRMYKKLTNYYMHDQKERVGRINEKK